LQTHLLPKVQRAALASVVQVDSTTAALRVTLSPRALAHECDVFNLHLWGILHGKHLIQQPCSQHLVELMFSSRRSQRRRGTRRVRRRLAVISVFISSLHACADGRRHSRRAAIAAIAKASNSHSKEATAASAAAASFVHDSCAEACRGQSGGVQPPLPSEAFSWLHRSTAVASPCTRPPALRVFIYIYNFISSGGWSYLDLI
jgi:hypothetical protein